MGNIPSGALAKAAPIHEAAAMDNVPKLRQLLAEGEDVNAVDKDGWTPAHYATYGGAIHALEEILSKGGDPRAVDAAGRSPIHLAALRGSGGNQGKVLALLLASRVPADLPDIHGMTPLHKAAVQGHVAVVEALLQAGANPNAPAKDGSTPLHMAAHKGRTEVVGVLVKAGGDVRRARQDGETPLHEAAEGGHGETCKALLDLGALPGVVDAAGQTPADDARAAGHGALADALAALAPGAGGGGGGAYPVVYQGGNAPVPTAAVSNAVPFPGRGAAAAPAAVPAAQGGGEAAANAAFWNAALAGGGGAPAFPAAPLGRAPSVPNPTPATLVSEPSALAGWWAENLGKEPAQIAPPVVAGAAAPAAAAAAPVPVKPVILTPPPSGSREEFEAQVLAKAQGLFRAAAGAAAGVGAALNAGRPQKPQKPRAGGAAVPAPSASDVKLDLEPFDDDDYEVDMDKAAAAEHRAEAVSGDLGAHTYREKLAVQRRLAALEMELDKAQGWVRGGTKADTKAARAARARMATQENQIEALKRQLAVLVFGGGASQAQQRPAATPAAAAPSPLYAPAGHTLPSGGSAFSIPRVPVEFVCPIAQTVMREPVIAADGVTYERAAILAWLQSGHAQSPVTGAPLAHPGLTPNRALADAIRRFK